MNRKTLPLLALLLFFLAPLASAQSPAPATSWLPHQGLWWTYGENGIFYDVSVGPNGFMFVAITLYRPDGEPTFLVMQGPFEPEPRATWSAPGVSFGAVVTGRLRSPLYRMQGGQCLGCDYRPSQTVASEFGDAELEFHYDGSATFIHDGHSKRIQPFQLYTSAASLPQNRDVGDWIAVLQGDQGIETSRIVFNGGDGNLPDATFDPASRFARYLTAAGCGGLGNLIVNTQDTSVYFYTTYHLPPSYLCFKESFHLLDREGVLRGDLDPTMPWAAQGLDPNAKLTLLRPTPRGADVAPAAWRPQQGLWWNPAQDGIFYHVSVGPAGFMFVTITLYDASGEPTFLVMQGDFAPSSLEQWSADGETGRLRSPLYRMQGGSCLDCAYRASATVPSEYGDAELVFHSDGRAAFHWRDQVTPIETFPLYTSAAGLRRNRLQGRWHVQLKEPDGAVSSGIVKVERDALSGTFGAPNELRLAATCEACDERLSATIETSGDLVAYERSPTLERIVNGGFVAAESAQYEFHERDGVLLGRPFRAGTHPVVDPSPAPAGSEMTWTKLPD